jgi:hypothetical protein
MLNFWTDDEVKQLVRMFVDQNKTTADIATALKRSRNSVTGKLSQLNIRRSRNNVAVTLSNTKPVSAYNGNQYTGTLKEKGKMLRELNETVAERLPQQETPADAKPLEALNWCDCRYPYGFGPYLFCGKRAILGKSWCKTHYAAVFVKGEQDDNSASA